MLAAAARHGLPVNVLCWGRLKQAEGSCMWGTDWTRAVGLLTYQQGVDAFRNAARLSTGEKRALMAGTLERVYKWSPTTA